MFLKLIGDRLEASQFGSLGTYELGVWATPPGTLFVDGTYLSIQVCSHVNPIIVLASKKANVTLTEKGKDADIKKWEADLRKTLAQKGSAQPTLTKQEKALVDAQLEKEELSRNQLRVLQRRLKDGLSMIQSLLESHTETSLAHLPWLASLLMEGVIKFGMPLVGSDGISTYFVSSSAQLSLRGLTHD